MNKKTMKPGTLLAPCPVVMVSCGTEEEANILTIAWTGIVNSDPAMTYISVRPSRYSYEIIKKSGEFVINLATAKLIFATDFCGVKSGADVDKFKETGLTKEKASKIKAPMIAESPINIECRVKEVIPLGSHDMFLAEIVAVNVSEDIIDKSGKLRFEKCGLAAFSHGQYFALGAVLGNFGFSVKKKSKRKNNGKNIKGNKLENGNLKPKV